MEEKEIIVCEKCGNKVHPATLKSNEQYPELEGKPYCKDCRDDVLKECGEYNCMGCGEIVSKKVRDFTLSKFDKVLCYKCQKKEQKGELEVTSVPAILPEIINSAIVRPALSPNDSLSAWHAFQELKVKIKSPLDVTNIRGKEYLGKSFWRKMATFFNLTDEILDRKFEYNDRGFIQSAYYEIKIIAPNGRSTTGIGFCSAKEREFAHPDHDIRATAHCVPQRAEILTKNGFKLNDDLIIGEDVLSYSIEDNMCYWIPLEDITKYESLPMVCLSNNINKLICSEDHSWVTEKNFGVTESPKIGLTPTNKLKIKSSIILAANAEEGSSDITPREAAILGWILTDGIIAYDKNRNLSVCVYQSKEKYVREIRELLKDDTNISMKEVPDKLIDGNKNISGCRNLYTFYIPVDFARKLLIKAGVVDKYSNFGKLATSLTHISRKAMLKAMLHGDGSIHGKSWLFINNRMNIMELFQILATLEGKALGNLRVNSKGSMHQQIRIRKRIGVHRLKCSDLPNEPAWCPTTKFGTWIMRLDGRILITGNTRAKNRGISDMTAGGEVSAEEISDE